MKLFTGPQWLALIAAIILTIACFMPWVIIETPFLTLTGVDTMKMRYGKPAYNHFILTILILMCTFIPKVWAKRINLLFGVLNLSWAIRNFILFSRCEAGECPQKQWGLYLILITSIILMITALFPKMELTNEMDNSGV